MGEKTNIEWADSSWNPWIGCTKVGPGCDHCYAENLMDTRHHKVMWGPGNPRVRTGVSNWNLPKRWNSREFVKCAWCDWRGELKDFSRQDIGMVSSCCPSCGNEAYIRTRRRVFCSSLADVFDNEVDPAWRADLLNLIAATPNLDWLLLTKRIGNVTRMLVDLGATLPSNVWLGATIVNQEEADRDIPKLLATPARVRFLSMEPLLGPVDLNYAFGIPTGAGRGSCPMHLAGVAPEGLRRKGEQHLQWVIVGGESGKSARPMQLDWVRSLRDQCAAAGVDFHFKQHGEYLDGQLVGKKAAGRLLDGVEHNAFPEVCNG